MDLVTDDALALELYAAMLADQEGQPRNRQVEIGPSGLGSCREYIRATMAGDPSVPEEGFKAAAWVGTVGGDYIEKVLAARLGARVQGRTTATLPRTGLKVSGSFDVCFVDRNILVDLKSKDGFAELRRSGPSLEHMVQVAVYVLGLVQEGVLTEGASARLAYWDRSGREPEFFLVLTFDWSALMAYIDVLEDRLSDVVWAQEQMEQGNLEARHDLRDKSPSWCFSPKVQCPFRYACWGGSEWQPNDVLAPEHDETAGKYLAGRAIRDHGNEIMREARSELEGVAGTGEQHIVAWTNDGKRLDVFRQKGNRDG